MGFSALLLSKKQVFSLLGPDRESSSTMVTKLLLPCLLGLVVEVWGQQYPPTYPPTHPPTQPPPPHQPGYAPAGYAPAQGYGASGGHGRELMQDPFLLSMLLDSGSGLADDNLMLMASMMGNMHMDPMMMMHLMRSGGFSSNPMAMMAMMGKKMNPLLLTSLMQCKEEHSRCVQPNNPRHEECGLGDYDGYWTYSNRDLLPCCTCEKTKETLLPVNSS